MTTTQDQLALAAGQIILAVDSGDRLPTAKIVAETVRTADALDLIEAVASVAIESARLVYGDGWASVMSYALLDIETRTDVPASERTPD